MTSDLTDEMLMAYADGELDPARRRNIEQRLRMEPDARTRLRAFLRTGRNLASAYDAAAERPAPEFLRQTTPEKVAPPQKTTAGWMPAWRIGFSPASAAFAALALLVGVAAGVSLQSAVETDGGLAQWRDGQFIAAPPLETALNSMASAASVGRLPGSTTPVQTFLNSAGEACREYETVNAAGIAAYGVACRSTGAQWSIRLHVTAAGEGPNGASFTPAGADAARQAADAFVSQIVQGAPLGAEAEAAFIAQGWRRD